LDLARTVELVNIAGMSTATIEDLRRNLDVLLLQVEQGNEILIQSGSKIVAKLGPVSRDEWSSFALEGLARAYGENEPEYGSHLLKEANPEYRA
jgi:antitoxin (DNA-binding transcriptional repressor) of toxin-antitoxin stability system